MSTEMFYKTEMLYEPLYKRDNKGKIRIWWMEIKSENSSAYHRTCSGLVNGKIVKSEWKKVSPTNLGKKNERQDYEQAKFEVESLYTKQKRLGYFENINDIDNEYKFNPMLATAYDKVKIDWNQRIFSQPKLDGIRCIAKHDGLWTRSGKKITSCNHIFWPLMPLFKDNENLIIDGELYNHDLKDDFNKITSLVRKQKLSKLDQIEIENTVEYHVYDMYDGEKSFYDRYETLRRLVSGLTKIVPVKTIEVNKISVDEEYAKYLENGYEGQIIRYDTPYENKRTKKLIKRKEFITEEFPVISIEEGKGNWEGYIKGFTIDLGDDIVCKAGVRGTQEQLKELFINKITPKWATVRYFGKTPDGMLRFPVVVDYGFENSRID